MTAVDRVSSVGPKAAPDAIALMIDRIRLRARLRTAWLRHLWTLGGDREGGRERAITHTEVDGVLADLDAPESEAAWLATDPGSAPVFAALREVEQALAADVDSRFARLCSTFALDRRDVDVLTACLGPPADPSLERLYAYLQDHAGRGYATDALVARLFGWGRATLLPADSPLQRWELVQQREVAPGGPPLWECDQAIRDWVFGADALDPALAGLARVVPPREPLPSWPVQEIAAQVERHVADAQPARVRLVVSGMPGSGRRTLAATLAARLGLPLLAIDTSAATEHEWSTVYLRAQRRAWLDGCALAWVGDLPFTAPWSRVVPWFPVQFAVGEAGAALAPLAGVIDHRVDVPPLTADERLVLWRYYLPDCRTWPRGVVEQLVAQRRVTVGQIAAVAARAPQDRLAVEALVREEARRQLGDLAQPLECPFAWDDLVVPTTLAEALRDLAFEAEQRVAFWDRPAARRLFPQGRGLLALFSGPSGTGKTMATQVLAAGIGVDLFRVSLSAVVSKYVGETSRNLERILTRAADLDLVLLFDEADALFGTRTKVEDAHDRFANTDTGHLLQAIESYRGIAILATNRRGDVDAAFIRRLRYVLDFPLPDAAGRTRIWQRLVAELGGPARVAALRAELLGLGEELELSGAQIKNAVLSGLFHAQRDGKPLAVRHLLRGVERELHKDGRALSPRVWERWSPRGS